MGVQLIGLRGGERDGLGGGLVVPSRKLAFVKVGGGTNENRVRRCAPRCSFFLFNFFSASRFVSV